MNNKIIKFKKPSEDWEVTGKVTDLIKQAEGRLQYLEENGVGYYYYWMLEELKKLYVNQPGDR